MAVQPSGGPSSLELRSASAWLRLQTPLSIRRPGEQLFPAVVGLSRGCRGGEEDALSAARQSQGPATPSPAEDQPSFRVSCLCLRQRTENDSFPCFPASLSGKDAFGGRRVWPPPLVDPCCRWAFARLFPPLLQGKWHSGLRLHKGRMGVSCSRGVPGSQPRGGHRAGSLSTKARCFVGGAGKALSKISRLNQLLAQRLSCFGHEIMADIIRSGGGTATSPPCIWTWRFIFRIILKCRVGHLVHAWLLFLRVSEASTQAQPDSEPPQIAEPRAGGSLLPPREVPDQERQGCRVDN